jgi:phenylacetate-CoA ligase
MLRNRYWNRKMQTASAKKLKNLQLHLLKNQLQRAYDQSKIYRRKFKHSQVKPSDIKGLSDLRKIPFTSRKELETNFRNVISVPMARVATIRQTSGTTGTPMTVAHTLTDIERIANASARKLTFHGITRKDIVQVTAAYGLSQGAWSMHWGLQKVQACEIPVGPGDTERQIKIAKDFGSTVLYGVTNYHLRIAEVAKQIGEDLQKTKLETAICVSEKPTKQQMRQMKKEIGYERIFLDYGATEFPGFSVYCNADQEAYHVWADYYVAEILDPETNEPVNEGEKGELVITSLQNEAFPLIRYRSRDIMTYLGYEKCSCGMCHPKIGTEIDRKDFMVKVRGASIFPSRIEEILAGFPEMSGRCQIVVDKRTPKQEFTLEAETNLRLNAPMQQFLKRSIQQEIKTKLRATLDNVIFVPLGKFEDKMRKSITIE